MVGPPTDPGTLDVVHARTSVPRAIVHRFHLPMAMLQQLSLVAQWVLAMHGATLAAYAPRVYAHLTSIPPAPVPDVIVVDQLPMAIPLLKLLCGRRVLYYCHFPDKEISASLAQQQRPNLLISVLRAVYRWPLDYLEEATTGTSRYSPACADTIVANSHFTSRHFQRAFPRLHRIPDVVYPGVDETTYDRAHVTRRIAAYEARAKDTVQHQANEAIERLLRVRDRPTFVSINRFEAKKNVVLALDAFAQVRRHTGDTSLRLICAGGYDARVQDNIHTLRALQERASALGLAHTTVWSTRTSTEPPVSPPSVRLLDRASVVFFPSFPGPLLHALLLNTSLCALLYTPTNEHFGIVPLEAMACGVPVIATNTGGPLETVVDVALDEKNQPTNRDGTGFLLPPDPLQWAAACEAILAWDARTTERISMNAKHRVSETFSVDTMGAALRHRVARLAHEPRVSGWEKGLIFGKLFALALAAHFAVAVAMTVLSLCLSPRPHATSRSIPYYPSGARP